MDASFGSHPAFMLVKCVRRLLYRPWVVGAAALYAGYLMHHLRNGQLKIPIAVSQYVRKEQLGRLRNLLRLRGDGITVHPGRR
jgi:hypothetical protein